MARGSWLSTSTVTPLPVGDRKLATVFLFCTDLNRHVSFLSFTHSLLLAVSFLSVSRIYFSLFSKQYHASYLIWEPSFASGTLYTNTGLFLSLMNILVSKGIKSSVEESEVLLVPVIILKLSVKSMWLIITPILSPSILGQSSKAGQL